MCTVIGTTPALCAGTGMVPANGAALRFDAGHAALASPIVAVAVTTRNDCGCGLSTRTDAVTVAFGNNPETCVCNVKAEVAAPADGNVHVDTMPASTIAAASRARARGGQIDLRRTRRTVPSVAAAVAQLDAVNVTGIVNVAP
jgi:hypothetical protein